MQPGQKVLINGASGGVGTFAVQLAKIFGAEVTGVCSTRNVQMVGSLGADHVIDYTREDFTTRAEGYDLIIDNVGSHSLTDYRRVLNPKGALVIIGGPSDGPWLDPLPAALKAMVVSPFVSQRIGMMIAQLSTKDLEFLRDLLEKGKITPVVDRRYPLNQVPEAIKSSSTWNRALLHRRH